MLHHYFMAKALALAKTENPAPNPRVGAVIVKNNKIIGRGAHRRAGEAHAEIMAIQNAEELNNHSSSILRGAEIYVTLEPCCHEGSGKRTPPCTNALISAGFTKVIIGSCDPNPRVNGSGIKMLQNAGIEVICGVLEKEELKINKEYRFFSEHKRPWVHLKQAVSLDGFINKKEKTRTHLSGEQSLEEVYLLRSRFQAIMAGGSTVIIDNPKLDTRNIDGVIPDAVILEGESELHPSMELFQNKNRIIHIFSLRRKPLEFNSRNIKWYQNSYWDLDDVLNRLGEQNIINIFVEGGRKLSTSLLQANLVNEYSVFATPHTLGEGIEMNSLNSSMDYSGAWDLNTCRQLGDDIYFNWQKKENVFIPMELLEERLKCSQDS